jgi:hypothetical protein
VSVENVVGLVVGVCLLGYLLALIIAPRRY